MFMSRFIRTDYHAIQIFIPHRIRPAGRTLETLAVTSEYQNQHEGKTNFANKAGMILWIEQNRNNNNYFGASRPGAKRKSYLTDLCGPSLSARSTRHLRSA